MKIVINRCLGDFAVTKAVFDELGLKWNNYGFLCNKDFGIKSNNPYAFRSHPELIAAIEKIGLRKSSGEFAKLKIIEIPDDINWYIINHKGFEIVHEEHRTWK